MWNLCFIIYEYSALIDDKFVICGGLWTHFCYELANDDPLQWTKSEIELQMPR